MGIQKHIPEIGKQYGQWTIINLEIKRGSNRATYWRVRCQCGSESWRNASSLTTGRTNSCKSCSKTPNNINTYILSYYNKAKRRAEISNFEFNLTAEYLQDLFFLQKEKCKLSNLKIEFRPNYIRNQQTASLDRIDNTKGYIIGNVQWVHKQVNFMKGTMEQKEFIKLCKLIGSSKCG